MMKKWIALFLALSLACTPVLALGENTLLSGIETDPYDACGGNRACPMWYYADLAGNTWYHDGVHYCLDRELMTGCAGEEDEIFAPEQAVTRAELFAALYRLVLAKGADVTAAENTNILSFHDAFEIPEGGFAGFQWACTANLVDGEDPMLRPNDTVTRAELIAALYGTAQWLGIDTSVGEEANILSFDDAFELPEGSAAAIQWAYGAGVLAGTGARTIGHALPADRAQLAAFIQRFDTLPV